MYSESIQGIRMGLEAFDQSARRLANFETADVPRESVNMMIAENAVRANTIALQTNLSLTHEVIDILA